MDSDGAAASAFDVVTFAHGSSMKNRLMLAPLTNQQSSTDGTLGDDEYEWLIRRAEGGFGLTMTCASHVQAVGQGFPGQLGCFDDRHNEGLSRLADGIKRHRSVAMVQLHHGGRRSPADLIGRSPVAPSDDSLGGARALTTAEVEELVQDFVAAAVRCQKAGFDGVELHGAHDYIFCQFLNAEFNVRSDRYGGTLENRSRVLFEVLDGIRSQCGSSFVLAVRLSPERFGMQTEEIIEVYRRLDGSGQVDFIDMSLRNSFRSAIDPSYKGRALIDIFAGLGRENSRLAVAGKLDSGAAVRRAIDAGVDIAIVGKAAITNHDFPMQLKRNHDFSMRTLPVQRDELRDEGLSESFIDYMRNWKGFVEDGR